MDCCVPSAGQRNGLVTELRTCASLRGSSGSHGKTPVKTPFQDKTELCLAAIQALASKRPTTMNSGMDSRICACIALRHFVTASKVSRQGSLMLLLHLLQDAILCLCCGNVCIGLVRIGGYSHHYEWLVLPWLEQSPLAPAARDPHTS